MNFLKSFLYVSIAALVALTSSCAQMQTESYDQYETKALEAWIYQHRNDLKDNKQTVGGYYVDVIEVGDGEKPVSDTACWVKFEFTGRSLSGNVALTRNAEVAVMENTFTNYTRYVPFYRFCGTQNTQLLEGTYLAMRNTLKLGEAYYDLYKTERKFPSRDIDLRIGTEVDLYMPSSIVGSGGIEGSGGYEGQYALSSSRPMIVRMKILEIVKNPLELEGTDVDQFCEDNGGLKTYSKETDGKDGNPIPTDPKDKDHPYNVPERWVSASDSVAQLYVNYRYTPDETLDFKKPYISKYGPYAKGVAAINADIAAALKKRFHKDEEYKGIPALGADSVGLEGTAKIWYIGRFADGFIFDTNIDEVKKIIYEEVTSSGEVLSYTPSSGGQIQAFYYTIPHMQFGQWGAFITTSTYGYGASGKTGSSITSGGGSSSSNYLDYINYQNYQNSYYGNSYMGGYYGNYYGGGYGGGYGNGYYDPYYGSNYDNSSTGQQATTTTVNTEIPAYSPLIFQFFIEPEEE